MVKPKYKFIDPNPADTVAEILLHIFVQANLQRVEKIIGNTVIGDVMAGYQDFK